MTDLYGLGEKLAQDIERIEAAFRGLQQKMIELLEAYDGIESTPVSNPPNEYARKTASLRNRNRQNLYSKTPKTKYKPPIRRIN